MSMLPSPIPHPLDYCPWDVPGWIHEALDWVVGVEWPDGNERAVWDLADHWYGVADVLAGPHTDATAAAVEVRSGYGGVGLVAEAFGTAWHRVAEDPDAPLPVLLAVTGELGRLVESCGCDLEGAKLEAWIELGVLVIELLSLAVATVLTAGAASPAASAAITASRMVVQQIFKRLVAQLARKALREGLKEAGERAAKEVVKGGVRGVARRAALGGLVEAGQEAGTSLATQAYQNSTGRRDGLDLTDVGTAGLGGFAGGAVAPVAGLGRHAHGGLAQVGERLGREMAGETLAEGTAALAIGQGPSLEDLARAAVSGVGGSATGQAETALHHRLDARLADLTGPLDLSVPLPEAGDPLAAVPTQRAPEPVVPSVGAADGPAHARPERTESRSPVLPSAGDLADSLQPEVLVASTDPPVAHTAADPPARPGHAEVPASPTLSSVAVESPVVAPGTVPGPAPVHAYPAADVHGPGLAAPGQTGVAPTAVGNPTPIPPQPIGPPPADRLAAGAAPPAAGPGATPAPAPRFPLLEALAAAPRQPASDPSPALPGPFDPFPPRRRTSEKHAAWRAAEREALDRRRYQAYFQAQRQSYEEHRREEQADWLRERAVYHEERAGDWAAQAIEFHRAGRTVASERWHREANEAIKESDDLREGARQVLAGSLVPAAVIVEDDADFYRINDDVADLAPGAVETPDRSALTGDGHPPPIDRSRRYGVRGGLRPPLSLHQTDLERQMPRNPDGTVVRNADPRHGGWFQLANDGGMQADATRGINCLDCTLSLYETWVHGRPRVSAPRTFDGYLQGDVLRPSGGEEDGPRRVEQVTGGRFQDLCSGAAPATFREARERVERGYLDLHGQLLAGGHGSYAFLITTYEGGGSHAWVALNQNGSVLYLDPQSGQVSNHPLYVHSGAPHRFNVVGIDALVLGPDARPMPLPGRPPGLHNALPDPPERPDPLERPDPPQPPDPPAPAATLRDVNHVHLLGRDTTIHRTDGTSSPGSAPTPDPGADLRQAHLDAHRERIAAGIFVRDAIAASDGFDGVFAAGVSPVELAQHVDGPGLQRIVPALSETAAADVVRLLADPRVQRMLDETWESPPRDEPLLAETVVRQFAQRPDLVGMILATPELANSLTARPLTLHHLASHQKAIDVLGQVLNEIAERGAEVVAAESVAEVAPTPLTEVQRHASALLRTGTGPASQPGFDENRRSDPVYRREYLDRLFAAATAAQAEIDELGSRIADPSPGHAVYEGRSQPKDRQRAEDKVVKYRGDVSRLKDLAAGRVAYQRLADLYGALATLQAAESIQIVEYEDRFVAPQASGYRDVQMMLRTSTGHIAEFRLELTSLQEVAEWEHSLYAVKRDLETIAAQQGRSLSTTELAIRNGILREERRYFWQALQSALGKGAAP